LKDGGLELVGARPLPAEAAPGGPLKVGLLWRVMRDGPEASQVKLRLVRASGEVVQESVLPLFGGRISAQALRAGNVVRDEQTIVVGARVPTEALSLELALLDGHARLGQVNVTGRAHVFDAPASAADAARTFGGSMALLRADVEPMEARAEQTVTVKLRWQSADEMPVAYKVFVHVLDPGGEKVVAQRDAEPQDGRAPTSGWVIGETIDDEYQITLPADVAAGQYPLEVGVYEPRSGDRLRLPSGDTRLILDARLRIR
jgi:hypothetical protein